jgi:hypothetical protein
MKTPILAVMLVLTSSAAAKVAFTDFSDYTERRSFLIGETFESQGLQFKSVAFRPHSNQTRIVATSEYAVLLPSPGVEFLLPTGAREASLRYSDGAAARIAVNGVEPATYPGQGTIPFHAGFSFLDGTSLD